LTQSDQEYLSGHPSLIRGRYFSLQAFDLGPDLSDVVFVKSRMAVLVLVESEIS